MKSIWRSRTLEAAVPDMNLNARPRDVVKAFRRSLALAPILVVDVGGRGGLSGELSALARNIDLIAFEPDENEAARLRESFSRSALRSARVSAAALGRPGKRTLHVTREPGRSSLYEPNPAVIGRYGDSLSYEVVDRREIETVELARALSDFEVSDVDYLKLDAQGVELEILETLDDSRLRRVLIVECEVEFVEIYTGQPRFHHVDRWLSARGFELFQLSRVFSNYGGKRGGPYGRGQLIFGDAVYVRTDVAHLPPLALAKLILLSAYCGHTDYAAHLFASYGAVREQWPPEFAGECASCLGPFFQDRSRWARIAEAIMRISLDRVLFSYLGLRRWNGLKTDSDRCYPIR